MWSEFKETENSWGDGGRQRTEKMPTREIRLDIWYLKQLAFGLADAVPDEY